MSCIYVLACEHDTFYVGRTIDIISRFNAHKNGFGSIWCRAHLPKSIVELKPDLPFLELTTTLMYMKTYGIEKVRGGPWCSLTLTQGEIDTIEKFFQSEGFARKDAKQEQQETDDEKTRKGKSWSAEEDAKFLAELAQGQSLSSISAAHGRTEGAIRARATLHVKRLHESGTSPEEISAQMNMTLKDVQQCLFGRRGPDLTSHARE